ncbi:LysE family translocator [Microbulbifer sp. PSTR4-B]|uniref:LysE family translocator n=1 Tax=Microbulbifer sp. PSTR4-B TaxID=3243396 RepID=UPI0040399BE0
MPEIHILTAFLGASALLAISPGPDLVLISTYSATRGFLAGFLIGLGVFIAGLIQTLLVAFGLGQIMQAMPLVAIVVKTIGALYLAWLGYNLLRSWRANLSVQNTQPVTERLTPWQLLSRGLINNLINPKALLFFSLFLPQFTTSTEPLMPQILLLGILLSTTALIVNTIFSLSFSQLGHVFKQPAAFTRHSEGILGAIFLGLAARLATER